MGALGGAALVPTCTHRMLGFLHVLVKGSVSAQSAAALQVCAAPAAHLWQVCLQLAGAGLALQHKPLRVAVTCRLAEWD